MKRSTFNVQIITQNPKLQVVTGCPNLHVRCCGGKKRKVTWNTFPNPRPRLSTSYLHSLHREQSRRTFSHRAALSRPDLRRGRLFKFKSVATLPVTDCKRRFISCPAAALKSVIVIQRWGKSCHRVLVILGWGGGVEVFANTVFL